MADVAHPRILLIGSRGQVGHDLEATLTSCGEVLALAREHLDLAQPESIRDVVRETACDVIVNAAAYTHVDRAEREQAHAWQINAEAPAVLAAEAHRAGALLVHFSTDYVFPGDGGEPYREGDAVGPVNAYGRSKLAGDEAILSSAAAAYIFRIGWVYSAHGRSFLTAILRRMREADPLRVVADQHGSPTWSRVVAEVAATAVAHWLSARSQGREPAATGVYHAAAPDHTTWCGFATAIVETISGQTGGPGPRVDAIGTEDYPSAAPRPRWSVLNSDRLRDAFDLSLPPWRTQLETCLAGVAAEVASR